MLLWTMSFIVLACGAKSTSPHALDFGGDGIDLYTAPWL